MALFVNVNLCFSQGSKQTWWTMTICSNTNLEAGQVHQPHNLHRPTFSPQWSQHVPITTLVPTLRRRQRHSSCSRRVVERVPSATPTSPSLLKRRWACTRPCYQMTNPTWCFIVKHRWQLTRAQGCQSLTLMQWSLLLLHESLAKPFPPLEQTLR